MTTAVTQPALLKPEPGEVISIDNASWELYERLVEDTEYYHVRITYDQGRMTLMSPLPIHEKIKRLAGRLIEWRPSSWIYRSVALVRRRGNAGTWPRVWSPTSAITFRVNHSCMGEATLIYGAIRRPIWRWKSILLAIRSIGRASMPRLGLESYGATTVRSSNSFVG